MCGPVAGCFPRDGSITPGGSAGPAIDPGRPIVSRGDQGLRVLGRGTVRRRFIGRAHDVPDLLVADPGPRHHARPGVPPTPRADAQFAGSFPYDVALIRSSATPPVLTALLVDAELKVVRAALQNPRLREEDLLVQVRSESVPPALLQAVAASSRWTEHYALRLALTLQPRTTLGVALGQISSLLPADVRRVAEASGLHPLVQAAARRVADQASEGRNLGRSATWKPPRSPWEASAPGSGSSSTGAWRQASGC